MAAAENTLAFTQLAESNIHPGIASSTLNLTQSEDTRGPIYVKADTNITFPHEEVDLTGVDLTDTEAVEALFANVGLRDSIKLKGIYNKSITQYMQLVSKGFRCLEASASSHIHLSHLAEKVLYESLLSVLQLTHSVNVDSVEPATNTLNLTQTVSSSGVIARSLSNVLDLNQVTTFYRIGDLCDYDPGVGAGAQAPSMTDPVLTRRSTILLTYPYVNPTKTVEIRNPQFSDNRQLEFRRINRKTRGGTLKIFRDDIWPESERLIYNWDNLKEAKKKELLLFFELTVGKEIGLLDFQSRQWRGIILTPTTQINNEDRPGNSLTMEFEGVVDPGGLAAAISGNVNIDSGLTDIPPGFQAAISVSAALAGNVIRD